MLHTNDTDRGGFVQKGGSHHAQNHEMREYHYLFARQSVALLGVEEPCCLHAVLDGVLILSIDEVKLHLVFAEIDI